MIDLFRRAWRADRWLVLAFALLSAATVLPIWIGRYLPLLDLPNHLSAMAVWHYYDDPRFDFAQYYTLNLKPLPYWAHYYVVHLLAYVFGVEGGNRIFLTAYALALPGGAALFARRFNRSPWLALFVFPLVWNFNLAEGFIAYVSGVAAAVLALVVVDWHCRRPTITSGLLVVFAGSSIYFFHLLTYMLFLVCAGLLVFTQREAFRLSRLIERGLPVLACALVGVWAYQRSRSMGFGQMSGSAFGFATSLSKPEFNFDATRDTLWRAAPRLLNFLSTQRDEWVVIVLALSWLAIAATSARVNDRARVEAHELGPEVCFYASVAAVLLMPRSMQRPFNWYMINGRFVFVCALFGALLIRGPVAGWRRWLFAPVIAAGLFYAGDVARMVVVFNRHIQGFDEVVEKIPWHKNTLTLVLPPLNDDEVNVNCFNQWTSYTQIRRGGYNFYNFAYGFPLKYKTYLPAPSWNHTERFDWSYHARGWDYFLTHNEGPHYNKFELFEPLAKEGKVRLVAERGAWKLWQKVARDPEYPAIPAPAAPAVPSGVTPLVAPAAGE